MFFFVGGGGGEVGGGGTGSLPTLLRNSHNKLRMLESEPLSSTTLTSGCACDGSCPGDLCTSQTVG